jgi:hypothetical protein
LRQRLAHPCAKVEAKVFFYEKVKGFATSRKIIIKH